MGRLAFACDTSGWINATVMMCRDLPSALFLLWSDTASRTPLCCAQRAGGDETRTAAFAREGNDSVVCLPAGHDAFLVWLLLYMRWNTIPVYASALMTR